KMDHRVKKLMDRKGISRLGNLQNNGSESTRHTCKQMMTIHMGRSGGQPRTIYNMYVPQLLSLHP
nr:hypothetical protein [Tanacetum cinerariifolium]